MAGDDKRREPLRKRPQPTGEIADQSTRRDQLEPPNQIVLGESFFLSEGTDKQRTGSRFAMPDKIGQYQISRELGRGGMGVVYLAKQPGLNREVALKVLNINLQSDPEDAARFQSEAKLAASLQHPNIVQIYEVGEQDGYAFMAMEYVPGGNLHQHLRRRTPTPREAAELLEPLARAMHHAHGKGIIHRDLKPGNILISDSGMRISDAGPDDQTVKDAPAISPSGTPKITDFGLAKNLNQSMHLTATGVALGTPSYMAPEQAKDDRKNIGPLSDVYALGAILYEMLAGKPPFTGSTPMVTMQQVVRTRPAPPSTIRPAVPKELEKICLKCLEKQPKNRFTNAQELADALQAFIEGPAEEIARPERRIRLPWIVSVAAMIVAVLAAIALYWQHSEVRKLEQIARERAAIVRMSEEQHDELLQSYFAACYERALALAELGQIDLALKSLDEADKYSGPSEGSRAVEQIKLPPAIERTLRINLAEWREQNIHLKASCKNAFPLNALAWSRDGKLFASAGSDGRVRFFTSDGKESGKPMQVPGETLAHALAWSPKGDLLAVGGSDGRVFLCDPVNREIAGDSIKPDDLSRPVWHIRFANDGKTLITASQDGGVRVFDVASRVWQAEPMPREEAGSYVALDVSPDSKLLAAGGKSGTLRVWELKNNQPKEFRSWKLGGEIRAVAFSPEHRCLVAGAKSGMLVMWDRITDRLSDLPTEDSTIVAVAFSSDGQTFVTATENGSIRLWDACSRQPIGQPIIQAHPLRGVSFHPSANLLVVGDDRGDIRMLTVPRSRQVGAPLQIEPGPNSPITGLAYSRDGSALLTISNGHPRVWSADGKLQKNLGDLHSLVGAIHPDGRRVALGGRGGRLHLFDLEQDRNLMENFDSLMRSNVRVAVFSPDGNSLLTIAEPPSKENKSPARNSAWLWTGANPHKPRPILENLGTAVNAAAWHPDGRRVALACDDGRIIVWNIEANAHLGTAIDLGTPAQCVAISPDGKRLAAGGLNGVGRIWNLDDGGEIARPLHHSERIAGIAFSPDSHIVLTGSHDKTARYWDAATGWPLGPALRHPEAVLSVGFHPQSKHALTGCKDSAARFWRLPSP